MKLALHACCGPCLLEPLDAFSAEAERLVVVYANPNIHPVSEYERRRDTLLEYAEREGVEVVELPYDPAVWLQEVRRYGHDRESRCRACYRLRMTMVAEWAAGNGFGVVATTLTVSPYQYAEAIAEEGEAAASRAGVAYADRDFRDRYAQATARSRELEMYRQNYCGCLLSEIEARAERAARKAERKAEREARGGGDERS